MANKFPGGFLEFHPKIRGLRDYAPPGDVVVKSLKTGEVLRIEPAFPQIKGGKKNKHG